MDFFFKPVKNWVLSYFAASATNSYNRRKRFVRSFLKELPDDADLIDVGAGSQRYRSYASHLNYVSQDFCEYDGFGDGGLNQSKEWDVSNVDLISDILEIPVKDNSFDYALCTDVLEHVPRAYDACKEIRRIVKNGGEILITVPTQCDAHQTPYFFSGGYSHYFFKEVFKDDLVEITYESGYFETVDQKIFTGLVNLINLTKTKKSFRYLSTLIMYLIVAAPLVLILRSLPKFFEDTGNNGLLILVTKSSQ